MRKPIVFAGPSLLPEDREVCEIDFRPPAQQGDVIRCQSEKPAAIGLIDGYFGILLSVHQKELIEAINNGISVFGSSSMGALRAAELSSFGMIGVGGIFEDYRDGRLEADADVAVTHGPAELGFPATSLSMVDLRATIDFMRASYPKAALDAIQAAAEKQFFADRTFESISQEVGEMPFEVEAALKHNFIHRKRLDAKMLLDRLLEGELLHPGRVSANLNSREYFRIKNRALAGPDNF